AENSKLFGPLDPMTVRSSFLTLSVAIVGFQYTTISLATLKSLAAATNSGALWKLSPSPWGARKAFPPLEFLNHDAPTRSSPDNPVSSFTIFNAAEARS